MRVFIAYYCGDVEWCGVDLAEAIEWSQGAAVEVWDDGERVGDIRGGQVCLWACA